MGQIGAVAFRACLGGLSLLAVVTPAVAGGASADPPRYRFRVGDELIYKQTSTEDLLKAKGDEQDSYRYETLSAWRVYVARQNEDGSWRLLIRKHHQNQRIPKPDAPVDWKTLILRSVRTKRLILPGQAETTFDNDFLGSCDLRPDGGYDMNASLGDNTAFKIQPDALFLRLPADAASLTGWAYDDAASGSHFELACKRADDGQLEIAGTEGTALDENYEMTQHRTVRFDLERGLPEMIVRESESTSKAYPWHTRTTVELAAVVPHEDEWIDKLAADAAVHLEMSRKWWKAFQTASATRTQEGCRVTLDEVRSAVVALRDQATLPEIRELYDSQLRLHDRDAKWAIDEAAEREELYAKPPADWETEDLDGRTRRLVDFRGQVVLMDFWYRGCSHCIKALPKVKTIYANYRDKPVAVLGINNDQVEADARFVIEQHKLKYPTLKNGEISKSYGVSTWPTFVVLDQTGRVALWLSGNSDTLEVEVSRTIDELLARPPG